MAGMKPIILDSTTGKKREMVPGVDQIDPDVLPGGAKSMILSFASGGEKHVSSTSPTYESLAHFIYAGSDVVGGVNKFNINAWTDGPGTVDVRIVSLTSGLTIVELLGISSTLESNLQDMGTITNIPTTEEVFEIQGKKTGGGAKLFIASLEIQYG